MVEIDNSTQEDRQGGQLRIEVGSRWHCHTLRRRRLAPGAGNPTCKLVLPTLRAQ